jgi:hypothetical protein
MKKILLIISLYVWPLVSFSQSSKEQAFVNTVKKVAELLSKRDSIGLSKYTNQQGVYMLYRIGVFDRYSLIKKIGFSDTTYPNAPFYDGVRYTKIHYSTIPTFDCEKWTKTGVFADTSRIDHLLSKTAKNGNRYATQKTPAKTIAAFYALELKSRRVVIADNNGNELIFYLSYLNNKWWLTIIDKVTTDCSV